jgi:hypothetical protein
VPKIHPTWGRAQWWALVSGVTKVPVSRWAANFMAEECWTLKKDPATWSSIA